MPDGVSWRDYVDMRLEATERAVTKAEEQLRERLASMNEFRDALKDQSNTLATRQSLELSREQLTKSLDELATRVGNIEKQIANAEGRTWMAVTGLGVVFTLVSIALRLL